MYFQKYIITFVDAGFFLCKKTEGAFAVYFISRKQLREVAQIRGQSNNNHNAGLFYAIFLNNKKNFSLSGIVEMRTYQASIYMSIY